MSAITFSSTPRIIADGAYVTTTTVATWSSRPNGTNIGDILQVTDTGMTYVWNSTVSRWVLPEASTLTLSELATVVGDNASLTTEGWTHSQSGGTTTTDGTRVSISINASVSEQWSVTPTSGRSIYFSGYFSMSDPSASQQQIQLINGTKYCLLTKNSVIGTNPEPFVLRANSLTALRSGEYASSITDATERWIDVFYDPNTTTGQVRIYIDHEPWFGCGTSALETGGSLSTISLLVTTAGSGTRNSTIQLRDVSVIEGV